MKKVLFVLASFAILAGCQRGPGGVLDKVLVDFGLREKPEGYTTGADKVFENLDGVGATEIKRLNLQQRQGTIKFQRDGMRGMYYKEIKVYEQYYPLEASPVSHGSEGDRGYNAYIEFSWRMYQSARKPTRTEALAENADIATDTEGREAYRYNFSPAGAWDGNKGQRTHR